MSNSRSTYEGLLFYTEKSGDSSYSSSPPGRLDVGRLVRSTPPWLKPQSGEEQKKKTLILSNWNYQSDIDINMYTIQHAIEAGFTIYGCNGADIFPIAIEDCIWYNQRIFPSKYPSPIHEKFGPAINTLPNDAVIQLACHRYSLARDQVQVMDSFWLYQIFSTGFKKDKDSLSSPLPDYSITLSRLHKIKNLMAENNQNFSDLYPVLKNLTPKIDSITQDVFSEEANAVMHDCRKHLKDIPFKTKIKTLTLNERDLNALIKNGQLTLNNITITLHDITHVNSIKLIGVFTDLKLLEKNLETFFYQSNMDTVYLSSNLFKNTYKYDDNSAIRINSIKEDIKNYISNYVRQTSHIQPSTKQSSSPTKQKKAYSQRRMADPVHQPDHHLTSKRTKDDFSFEYQGTNNSRDQVMIIEKFSQYLTLTSQHCEYIPKLQDGMCGALANLFHSMSMKRWDKLINSILEWDGNKETLSKKLTDHFEKILGEFKKIYVYGDRTERTYLGDNLDRLTTQYESSFILGNPWHDITIKRLTKDNQTWVVYDPNFPGGYKTLNSLDQLIPQIHACLGKLVSVKGDYKIAPEIKNVDAFIRDGGLLALAQSSHRNSPVLLNSISEQYKNPFSQDVLQGLLLRDTHDTPAWARLIQHSNPSLNQLGLLLLHQFNSQHSKNYANKLIDSLSALSEKEKYFITEALISASLAYPKLITQQEVENIRTTLHTSRPSFHDKKNVILFNKEFETWDKTKPRSESSTEICKRLVSGEKKKCLIELSSSETVQAMGFRLQQHCASIKRPVFYIHSPDDLVCMAPYITRDGREGQLNKGPGGPLYDFLKADYDPDNPPLLIVNYDNFKAEDMVAFNTLLDDSPLIDKIKLPASAIVVGLINTNKPDCYQGEDFYSRFGKQGVEVCSLSPEQILPDPRILKTVQDAQGTFPINLCHAQDWKEQLLGRLVIQQDKLYFEEGILAKALKSGHPVEIQNGPWEDESFQFFWDQALALGHIIIDGKRFDISDTAFVKSEGYDNQNLSKYAQWDNELNDHAIVLNPGCFNDFFSRYQCNNETRQLETLPGFIEAHKGQILQVNVTRSLSQHEWAALLLECQKHDVRLQCHCAPTVQPPQKNNFWTAGKIDLVSDTPTWNTQPQPTASTTVTSGTDIDTTVAQSASTTIISSTDIDTTVAQLTQSEKGWKVIDISECHANDLLMRLDGKLNKKTMRFEFTETACALALALEKNEKVILKGRFSQELADALAQILLNRKTASNVGGKLVLVSSENHPFGYFPIKEHLVTANEKRAVLSTRFSNQEIDALGNIDEQPLCHSIARLSYQASQTNMQFGIDPWQGTKGLPGGIKLEAFEEDALKIKEKSDAFIHQRQNGVNAILDHSPFVFLTGLTGVGKSTFVENDLLASTHKGHRNKDNTNLYLGESAMQAWAQDNTDKNKILFIDEANITSREWSEFEGLFQHPPSILIAGKYYPLTEKHKVIFAGNPLSYGGERKLAPLFERHGNALVFEPLPPEFIYEKILKPVFDKSPLEKSSLAIAKEILKTYKFLCECSQDSVLISPRELQMMASLTLSHSKDHPNDDPVAIARRYAYLIAKNCTPEDYRVKFESEFSIFASHIPLNIKATEFLVTPSREPLYQQLNDLTALREYRRDNPQLNDAQKYGGLGGIVIEGEPGIGKSEFVKAHLIAHGYKEVDITKTKPDMILPDKPFYHMPVGMPLAEKKKLLLNAFDQGAIVIIDEINSSPMMERLLNDLLMGKRPKSEKQSENDRPITPGFMVIGTQNPISMAGRRATGAALARRLISVTMPPYPQAEMEEILCHRGLESSIAKTMVLSYIKKSEQARQEHKTPAPTFRDLLKTADEWMKAKTKNTPDLVITDEHTRDIKKTISIKPGQPLDDLAIHQIINAAIGGIYDYLKLDKKHLGTISLSKLFDSETGVNRASCFLDELKSSHSIFYKFMLLTALIKNTDGPTLVASVMENIQKKLNLNQSALLRLIETDIANQCNKAFRFHTYIANEYFSRYQTDVNNIYACANKNGEISKEIKKEIQNMEFVLENPKTSQLITDILQTLSGMTKNPNPDIKTLAKLANPLQPSWHSIREQCQPQASSGWSFFQPEPRDAFTNLLYNSIANFEQNLHFNGKINNLADLMLAEQNRSQKSKTSTGPKMSEGDIMKGLGIHPTSAPNVSTKVTNR